MQSKLENKELARIFVETCTSNKVIEVFNSLNDRTYKVVCEHLDHPMRVNHSLYIYFDELSAYLSIPGYGSVHHVEKSFLRNKLKEKQNESTKQEQS